MEGGSRSRSPRLLVLGAGPAQLGLLEAARARGIWLAVVDRNASAPGLRLADRRCILSTEDEPAIERLVGALGIEGLISPGTDWPIGLAARIAERSGLPHPLSPQTAVLAINKVRQRERLDEAGVPQPRWWVVAPGDPLPVVETPCVVKAPDRQGQIGLTLVRSAAGLGAAVDAARFESRGNLALVEELAPGPEMTVIGFSARGIFTALAVTDRVVAEPPAFGVALAHVWPSHAASEGAAVAERALTALGITEGPSYVQVRSGRTVRASSRWQPASAAGTTPSWSSKYGRLAERPRDRRCARPSHRAAQPRATGGRGSDALSRRSARCVRGSGRAGRPPGNRRDRDRPGARIVFRPLRRGSDRAGAVLAVGDSRAEALERADRAAGAIAFRVAASAGIAS